MKQLSFYKNVLKCKNKGEVFNYFLKTLKPSNMLWSYFVDWSKVETNTKEIEIALNTMNYLVGKNNFDDEFKTLVKSHPEIVEVIPALVVRDGEGSKSFEILIDYKKKQLVYENFTFDKNKTSDKDIAKYILFMGKTGIKDIITSQKVKNLVDYMFGVEAGLDSNGRKNRSGHSMEDIVEVFIKDYCSKCNKQYLKEADADLIKKKFGIIVPVDKSSRRYDFVIENKKTVVILETNFYSGGGSKLKSTAGEYRDLFDVLDGKYKFVWITDGEGWKSTSRPLRETFENNDYVINLSMLEKNILEDIIN